MGMQPKAMTHKSKVFSYSSEYLTKNPHVGDYSDDGEKSFFIPRRVHLGPPRVQQSYELEQ